MRLSQVRKFALSLPDSTEQPHFKYTSFRVGGRIFMTAPPGGEHLHIFVGDEHRQPALALHPQFLEKLIWGGKAVGVHATLANADVAVIHDLLRTAWAAKAPKRPAARRARSSIRRKR